jgi:homospermidine synthase
MLLNPNRGVVEAESMDSAFVLNRALPYLGNVFGVAVPSALLSEWLTGLVLCDFEIV